jgi:hypothetical protein
VQPGRKSRSVADVNHQVSKKTVAEAQSTRRRLASGSDWHPRPGTAPQAPTDRSPALGPHPARQVPASQAAAGAVPLQLDPGALLAAMRHRHLLERANRPDHGPFRCLSSRVRVNAQVSTASNPSHREHLLGQPSSHQTWPRSPKGCEQQTEPFRAGSLMCQTVPMPKTSGTTDYYGHLWCSSLHDDRASFPPRRR